MWALADKGASSSTRTCVRTCEGACVCVRMGVPLREGLRMRVSKRVRACEGAHIRVCA